MAQENIFDAFKYFKRLAITNRLAIQEGFKVGFCSGPQGLEDAISQFQTSDKMILIDDTTSQETFSNKVGFFRRDVYTIFIVATYTMDDMVEREEKLNLCRRLFRQFQSRMIYDQDNMTYGDKLMYLNLKYIRSMEVENYFLSGVTGLQFNVQNEEPIDLMYNADEWTE